MIKPLLSLALLAFSVPAFAQTAPGPSEAPIAANSLQQSVAAELARAPLGTRFGLLVTDDQGREVVSINPDQRFIPASNTKLFTTAAALALPPANRVQFDADGTTSVTLTGPARQTPDLILRGGGGVSLSTAPDCVTACLATLADRIAAATRRVRNIVADDSRFVDQRWSPGMSWNNIGTDDGTATSALIVDENELPLRVAPTVVGQPGQITVSPYFTLRNETVTVAEGKTEIAYERAVNSRELRVYGEILAGAPPWRSDLGIDDPADYAAWVLRQALVARGVRVDGTVGTRHRPDGPAREGMPQGGAAPDTLTLEVAARSLVEEIGAINKASQNLHAEALLRRLGLAWNSIETFTQPVVQSGSREAGLAAMQRVLESAGIPRIGYDFSDGSGMSTYNRVSPRAGVALLRWGASQPWGAEWRASFPVGGVDGTLRRRFAGTALQGRIFAKTGTLNATNALSGYLIAASGRELTFSFFANDVPDGGSAAPIMDAVLLLIAAAN